jgi:hypothetical protein
MGISKLQDEVNARWSRQLSNPCHKSADAQHALVHLTKALGKLASALNESEHESRGLRPDEVGKYYGLWPCTECGCVVEDEYPGRGGDSFCSRCWPKVRLRRRDGLLREALPHLPAELATRVRLVLDRS